MIWIFPTTIAIETQLCSSDKFKHVRENEAFFFTSDSRKNSAGESQIRTTPNGYWKVYQDNVPIDGSSGEVIGFATKLFFHDVHGNITNRKMIEYRCHPSQIPTIHNNVSINILSRFMSTVESICRNLFFWRLVRRANYIELACMICRRNLVLYDCLCILMFDLI